MPSRRDKGRQDSGSSYSSSQMSSVFSYQSSAPSTYSHYTDQTFHTLEPDTYVAAQNVLPCEFVGYDTCEQTFFLEDTELWIDHVVSHHLNGQLPKKVLCWFCDEQTFDYRDAQKDRRLNFRRRMQHIRDHIVEEGSTVDSIRPDHHLNEHLYQRNLIPYESYVAVARWSEVPPDPTVYSNTASIPRTLNRRQRYDGAQYEVQMSSSSGRRQGPSARYY